MHCNHCGFVNGEDDHRCLRCGRRINAAASGARHGYSGANALATEIMTSVAVDELPPAKHETAVQPALFAPALPNVIPFDRLQRAGSIATSGINGTTIPQPHGPVTTSEVRPQRTSPRKTAASKDDAQGRLDFIAASPAKGRKLQHDVDAQIFCDQPVATLTHRLVASAIDAAVILMGFGVLLTAFKLLGGTLGSGKPVWIVLGASFALVSLLYGLIWAIAGRETAGMRFTDLQLITFDGFPVDARSRALRFASTWLSFCSGGLGLLWAIADEENLTWHDHISKTFPTIREIPGTFVKQRR